MFSAYCGKVKIFVCIVRYVRLYDVEKPGTFGMLNHVLQDTETDYFITQ